MDPSNEKLLDLIRLLDRSYARLDPSAWQGHVAKDLELRAKAEHLRQVLRESELVGKEALWQDLDWLDAEQTAEILDGIEPLKISRSADFVRHIDELQSLVSAEHEQEVREASEIASRALRDAIHRELQHAADGESLDAGPASGNEVPSPTVQIVARPAGRSPRVKQRRSRMWPIGVVVVIAIAVAWISLVSLKPLTKPSSPLPPPSEIAVEDPRQPEGLSDNKVPEPEDQVPPQVAVEPPRDVEPPPMVVDVPQPRRRPTSPQPQRPEIPETLRWRQVSGIVATQIEGSDAWYAVQAGSSSTTSDASAYHQFRTLGNSWGEAVTDSGIRVVLGPGAVARVAISSGDAPTIRLELEHGKVSVSELPASAQVMVAYQEESSEWLVGNHQTELAFDLEEAGPELQLVRGEIRSYGQSFTGPATVAFEDGGWVEGRLAGRATWLTRPPNLTPLERQLAIIATDEGDIVAGLLANRPGLNEFQARGAAVWGLSLDPVRTVPLALSSPVAAHRAAAAQWLIDPANDLASLRPVLAQVQRLLGGSSCNVPRWIAAVRNDTPLTKALAENMLVGLRPSEPLFVREMALSSFMKLTGQSFPYYNHLNPTRQGITQITRTLQPWIDQLP
jgi:cytoskeletal protein RodZ